MPLLTRVGQILLTHPRDKNFATLYEEGLTKRGLSLELFAAVGIEGTGGALTRVKKQEYEKLSRSLVSAFRKPYVAAAQINESIFEEALAAINGSLSRIISKGQVDWYGRLHIALAALYQNKLTLSVTGEAKVYLERGGEFILISEGLAEESEGKPTRIFANFASGLVAKNDRVILSTHQLFNYLSLTRLREFLTEDTLAETCSEVIKSLADTTTTGFATFIFELHTATKEQSLADIQQAVIAAKPPAASDRRKYEKTLRATWEFLLATLDFAWRLLKGLFGFVLNFFRRRPKKHLFGAIGIVVLLLLINVAIAFFQKSSKQQEESFLKGLTLIEDRLNEAEAAMIYNDEKTVLRLVSEAEEALLPLKQASPEHTELQALEERLNELKNKINKEVTVENPTVLTTFPNIPTELLRSPNGFLGYNRNSGSLAFYDFRSGETKSVASNQNTANLLVGDYVGGEHYYVFLNRNGQFQKLNVEQDSLNSYESGLVAIELDGAKIIGLEAFGSGNNARIYTLDPGHNQIYRSQVQEEEITVGAAWISGSADLDGAVDLAIDGGIYILFPDRLARYFGGSRQSFELVPVLPELLAAVKVFTTAEHRFIYIADPKNERILVFDKDGGLQNQIKSSKFRDLADLYVDEANNLIHALSGSELLQVGY